MEYNYFKGDILEILSKFPFFLKEVLLSTGKQWTTSKFDSSLRF